VSYERLESCPVCGKSEFRNKLVVEDKSVSKESFAIVQCAACSFQFTNPRPALADIGRYYESDDYVSHNSAATGVINQAYRVARFFTMRRKVALLNKQAARKGKLLDYGWQVAGYEPNPRAREEATQRVGQPIGAESLVTFQQGSFDAVTLWHVLEHVHTLNETLQQLVSLLKPDGVLIIAVPNVDSLDAQHYRQDWAAYDVPRHLYHFSPKTMKQLLKKHKLTVREMLPLPLDAYYVSMLSEKHKAERGGGLLTVLKAGYKSNKFAQEHGGLYSSVIYVAAAQR
jgi:hypothetical protein